MVERIIVGPLRTNAYVVSTAKKECVLIDPGAEPERILERLEVLNVKPRAILLTHGHFDHLGGVARIRSAFEEPVSIAIHENDAGFLGPDAGQLHDQMFETLDEETRAIFSEAFEEIPAADIHLKDGMQVLDTDLYVIHTPGHTPGSICFYSEERSALFSGDTLFFKSIGTTDIPDGSAEQLVNTIKTKIFSLPPETRLFSGHGPLSTVEREKNNNPALREEGLV